ncbi:ribosome assembly cofactor RimP [Aquimarina intermedia]|uniref:Ribosome maturation factor RimP n=1 Tax=Aquimarina intermedia TaxID=350814 RepID=A0A5S5CA64_9FLAO|nr:ribosome assembly cofactor RimP [Aquimarina intermedia]TYP76039.1 ribosome maturation factor RimP [Aquimarina intermedia]
MSLKEKVNSLLEEALQQNEQLFLISCEINADNQIGIVIDGDEGVTVEDCIEVSRAIEHNLDREEEDFSLQVMSAGVSEGLVHRRQYPKNVGRAVKVVTEKDTIEGKMIATDDESITLTWKAREPKPVGKGKVTVVKEQRVAFDEIKNAKVMITF